MHSLAKLDHAHVWHPFTQMREWLQREPIVITSGQGSILRDVKGRKYLDANASIWTNLHGHNHPKINAAIQRQLRKIAHSSALGLANEPAALLAEKLVSIAAGQRTRSGFNRPSATGSRQLEKVFFSDDGSSAMEVALKLAYAFARRARGLKRPKFLSLQDAYHGDTTGAVSLGHINLFQKTYAGLLFKADRVMAPYCYRCPFNRARPERADARAYRKCNWECVGKVEQALVTRKKRGEPYAAFAFEPLIQGAAGMIPQPAGWLRQVTELARGHGALLIADEVMTGFGRTGWLAGEKGRKGESERIAPAPAFPFSLAAPFACQHEGIQPDFLALAKGLTGGYLPMAATLTTQEVFAAFLGEYEEFKTFFHGHSYTGNQLGAAAALASLELLESRASVFSRELLQRTLRDELETLWPLPNVGDIRQVGLIAGIELVQDWRTRQPFDWRKRAGVRVCEAMTKRGVLTRPIGNVVVIMPPYCTTPEQLGRMVRALREAIAQVFGSSAPRS